MTTDRTPAGDIAIRVRDVSKSYVLFDRPEDRFKQMVVPRLERLVGRPPRRYFRDFAALSHVSFDIGRGETVGIVGRNGSGKSTLLQIVCGTLQPTAGSVEVKGRIAALLELGAGFNPEFTGRENVFLNASILGVPRKEMEWRFDEIARFADIGPFLDQPVKTYSSGMYLRLAFATAVNVDPDILVVDEALAVGDEAFQRKCFARIEQIKERSGTILFVSHGAQTIVQLCTRAMLFDGGELILQGRPKMVTGQYQRLVNASAESACETRAGILAMGGEPAASEPVEPQSIMEDVSDPVEGETANGQARRDAKGFDYYDPNLEPKSTVHLEERGAKIRDVRILTLAGEHVNVLQLGRRYILEYFVEFSMAATSVGFGMFVRTVNGVAVAGAQTINSKSYRTPKVDAGEVAHVRIEFTCGLLPSAYFVTCGVFGTLEATRVVMHRTLDAVMFRVAPEQDMMATGSFDLGALPQIQISSHPRGSEQEIL